MNDTRSIPGEPITTETRLRVNDDEVAAEIVDGEAVIINLGTGLYYTLDGTGCAVWAMIERRLSLAEMSEALAARYRVDRAAAGDDLRRLFGELLEERLVRPADPGSGEQGRAQTNEVAPAGEPYAAPALRRYTDMAEVLALDPPLPVLKDDA